MDLRRALHRICGGDPDGMLVHVIVMHMVEMAIVKIIHVAVMPNRGVPAIQAMLMRVVGVVFLGTCGHVNIPCASSLPIDPHHRSQ